MDGFCLSHPVVSLSIATVGSVTLVHLCVHSSSLTHTPALVRRLSSRLSPFGAGNVMLVLGTNLTLSRRPPQSLQPQQLASLSAACVRRQSALKRAVQRSAAQRRHSQHQQRDDSNAIDSQFTILAS